MDIVKEFKKAKKNNGAAFIKNYFPVDISWQRILNVVYKEALIESKELQEQKKNDGPSVQVIGNLLVQKPLWIAIQNNNLWNDFSEIKSLIYKMNKDFGIDSEFENCRFYHDQFSRGCDCRNIWHAEGIKVSLADRFVQIHSDPWDACYFQIIGDSHWRITGSEIVEYTLSPGDILFFPKSSSHEVWSSGPRSGLLINAEKEKDILLIKD